MKDEGEPNSRLARLEAKIHRLEDELTIVCCYLDHSDSDWQSKIARRTKVVLEEGRIARQFGLRRGSIVETLNEPITWRHRLLWATRRKWFGNP